jgi:predicted TIM-barrel fold metal-dependent hydrolase
MQTTSVGHALQVEDLDYQLFDADNHYYESEDAFLRYKDPGSVHNAPRWVEMVEGGARRLIFGDRMNRYVGADHTFSRVGGPGVLLKGEGYGELEPARAEYRERDARLALMDRQGLEATMLFPTLGVSVEQLLADDVDATYANLRAFNRWLDEDWGFNYEDRLYAVPLLSLLDPYRALDELEFVLDGGARVINLRPGPIAGRSPGDRIYDRFWQTVADADAAVAFHASDDGYRYQMAHLWGWGNVNVPARNITPVQQVISGLGRPIHDTLASVIYSKLFERFPTLRMASVELGCAWVPELLRHLEQAGPGDLDEHPIDVFKRHIWVTPFEHEDLNGLAQIIGTDRILFGSDFPHTDGLPEPVLFTHSLKDFDQQSIRKIMHDNARHLIPFAKS